MRSLPTKMKNKLWWKFIFIWLVIIITFSSRTQDMLGMTKNRGTAINHVAGSFTKGKETLFRFWFLCLKELVFLCAVVISQVSLFFLWFLVSKLAGARDLPMTISGLLQRLGGKSNRNGRWWSLLSSSVKGKLATTARCRAWKLWKVEQICIKTTQALHKCLWPEHSDSFGWKCACSLSCRQNSALWIWQIEQTKSSAESLGTWRN